VLASVLRSSTLMRLKGEVLKGKIAMPLAGKS
jgi:hypothetical protein